MSETLQPWVESLALRVYEGLNCGASLKATILLRSGEYRQLAEMRAIPGDYDCDQAFLKAYQASELLRKYPGLPLGIDVSAAARDGWWRAEAQCYKSNERLSPYVWASPDCDERILSVIADVRKEVISLIGPGPGHTWCGSFGPGATVTDAAVRCTIPDKLSSPVSMTPDAWVHLRSWSDTKWAAARREACGASEDMLTLSRGNVWFSVFKDATIDRSCAKEPSFNAFYQRGLGKVMAWRLKNAGFDLKTLPEHHKWLAMIGSRDDSLATIDLSSASDTVCYNLVKLLLPPSWFSSLDSLRSPMTLVQSPEGGEARWTKLEKFSSMGNGYTFELETVLFLAIARVASRLSSFENEVIEWVSVFGDDIIVPKKAARDVLSLLSWFGFLPNQRKTFTEGEFRESCGGDYFRGQAVRPYLLKDIPDGPQSSIRIANGLRRVGRHFRGDNDGRSPVHRAWLYCLDAIPSSVKACRGPEDLGDVVIHDDESRWTTRWRGQTRFVRVFRPGAQRFVRWDGFGTLTQLACALYLAGKGSETPFLDYRDRLASRRDLPWYKIGWTAYS